MSNQLYRTKENAILGGVCQGLAEYLRLDVLWVRVYFFLLVLATGLGFLVYLALWVIMPREDHLPKRRDPQACRSRMILQNGSN